MKMRKLFGRVLFAAATLAVVLIGPSSVRSELPAELKEELAKIEEQLGTIEGRVGKYDTDKIEISLKEVTQYVKEFAIEAELLDDDPVLKRLNKRIKEIGVLARASDKRREMEAAAKKNVVERKIPTREEVEIKIPVDLKNVSFKKDVAPIIANVCLRCHSGATPAGKFNASTYDSFVEMISPGDPDNSHVLNLVTGKAQPRMPRGGMTRFDKQWVEIWSAWIKQGAKFDGTSKKAPITAYLIDLDSQRRAVLARMSTPELEKLHRTTAQRQIEIVNPKKKATGLESPNFITYTTMYKSGSESDTEYVSVLAEAVVEELTLKFGLPKDQPLWRGRFGINVFADRYDFIAFARDVDGHQPESNEHGYVRLKPDHQYLACVGAAPWHSLDALVAENVAKAFVMQIGGGKVPPWAAYGFSRVIGEQFDGKCLAYAEELQEASRLAAAGKGLPVIFTESGPWVEMAPISASFFHFLAKTDKKKAVEFVKVLAQSGNWQQAVSAALHTTPDQLNRAWAGWSQSRGKGKKAGRSR